jgi:hypothetical protein
MYRRGAANILNEIKPVILSYAIFTIVGLNVHDLSER